MSEEPGKREHWERRWAGTRDEDFEWSLPGVAPQLRQWMESGTVADGRALDLGCGAGASTAYLAERFTPSVGLDLAVAALRQASANKGAGAMFVAGDATRLPFAAGSFAFVFDRGCLQNVPKEGWTAYFAEVDRILGRSGVLQLLVSKATTDFPSLFSVRGLRLRWLWYVKKRRGGPQFLTHDFLRKIRPRSFDLEHVEDIPFVTKKGKPRLFTHAVFRKA